MKEIKSPFWNESSDEQFREEIENIAKKYGYSQIFCAFCSPVDEESGSWHGTSNVISEGMIDYLEEGAIPYMREVLEDESK